MSCSCNNNNSCCNHFNTGGCTCGRANPIIAPTKVCTTCCNQMVEQPIICPIECRRVNNIVYYPRYYPQYTQTCVTQDNNNNSLF